MTPLELLLFAADPVLAARAQGFGVDAVILDLEVRGKHDRQARHDTQIAAADPSDVARVRAATPLPLVVRINGVGTGTPHEIEQVLQAGADEILVPMVRSLDEIDHVLEVVGDRAHVSCMVETTDAVAASDLLAARPIRRFYVGLNDLGIDRGSASIFDALVDGTVDEIAASLAGRPFGVAGLTHPRSGDPLPCQMLVDEIVRLDASFTFLRRSFLADGARWDPADIVAAIHDAVATSRRRDDAQRLADHERLADAVGRLPVPLRSPRS